MFLLAPVKPRESVRMTRCITPIYIYVYVCPVVVGRCETHQRVIRMGTKGKLLRHTQCVLTRLSFKHQYPVKDRESAMCEGEQPCECMTQNCYYNSAKHGRANTINNVAPVNSYMVCTFHIYMVYSVRLCPYHAGTAIRLIVCAPGTTRST